MKRRILIVTLSLVTLLGAALYAEAAPPGGPCNGACDEHCDGPRHGKGQPGGHFLERMSKILDLTEAQQASIKKIQAAEQEKTAALHEKKQENHQQLRRIEETKPLNVNALKALAEQSGEIETELIIVRARAHNQIDAILTPEQRELAATLRPEPGEKRHGGRCAS